MPIKSKSGLALAFFFLLRGMVFGRPARVAFVPIFFIGMLFTFISALQPSPVLAQAERAFSNPGNRVLSVDDGPDNRSLVIHLEKQKEAGRPVFNYATLESGETVLTADFVGLAWNSPARIIRLISPEKGFRSSSTPGLKEVRLSQFVDSPAVFRISFIARDPRLLKNVAVASAPGVLKVSWPGASVLEARWQSMPPAAPAVASGSPVNAPPAAGESRRLPRAAALAEQGGSTTGGAVKEAPLEAPPDLGPPPVISLVPCDNLGSGAQVEIFRVEMPQGREINFKAFRLHDPERYVIDIPNCPSITDAELPDVSGSALIKSVRAGIPNQNLSNATTEQNGAAAAGGQPATKSGAETGRLVLQLTDSQVNVANHFTPGSNFLSVTLGKGLMIGTEGGQSAASATSEKFSTAEISPGPIYVPRAPSETVIVLDAGHGGTDAGAVRSDIQEKDITLAIILKLQKILEAKGARIVLTRHDDTFVSLEDRVKITNQVGPNLFLSVHINSLEGTSNIYGIETYFQTELSRPLAERVHASLVAGLGNPDRNIRRARFYVINHTPVPAILAEVGYITNKAERERLISSDYQQKVASALARGVMLYLQDNGISAGRLANSGRNQAGRDSQ